MRAAILILILMLALISTIQCHTLKDILGSFEDVCDTCDGDDDGDDDDDDDDDYNGCDYLPYPGQCDKYIRCFDDEETYIIETCPPGLHWDASARTCNYPCAAKCPTGDDSCKLRWSEVLKTDESGTEVSGSKADLQEAVENGARIKFRTNNYSAETDNCHKINGDVCCQAILHIAYENWEEFQENSYWWMINICTTGNWHIVRYYVGGSYLSQSRRSQTFSWFVLKDIDGVYPHPIYSVTSDGTVTSGSRNALARAVEHGKSISIVSRDTSVFPSHNNEIGESKTVSAQNIWEVSQRRVLGRYLEYTSNAYWFLLILSADATRDIERWYLGRHVSRGSSRNTDTMDWFVDECWTEIQSIKYLKQLVESGRRVTVKFDNFIMEADNIMLSHDTLSVQLVSAMGRSNPSTFENDLYWEFRVIATTGSVRTYRPLVGSSTAGGVGTTTETKDLTWFVDTQKWRLLYHIADDGSVISGSALAVRNAVKKGAEIRVGYKRAEDTGFRYSKADNLNFGPEPDLSAQLVRLLKDYPGANDEFTLDEIPNWAFRLVNTKGYVRTTEWVVGEHVNKGRTNEKAEVKWFASF